MPARRETSRQLGASRANTPTPGHSIPYERARGNALPSYFLGFGALDETNTLLGWDQTLEIFAMLDIVPVPILL